MTHHVAVKSERSARNGPILANMRDLRLSATICYANQNHCLHLLQIRCSQLRARLLQTGFWTRTTATISFTSVARIVVKSHSALSLLFTGSPCLLRENVI